MREHDPVQPGPNEPEGGWEVAPTLSDTVILSVVLCRFTGERPFGETSGLKPICAKRATGAHADVECLSLYHQQEALASGELRYDMPALEVTTPAAGTDPTYQDPVGG